MRRALVAGGAGFVGSTLCEQLVRSGFGVLCLDNLSTGSLANLADLVNIPAFQFLHADATQPLDIGGKAFDVVYHLASPASPKDYLRLPLETLRAGSLGTQNLLEIAAEGGAHFALASTSEVYGMAESHPQPETYWGRVNPVGQRSVYCGAKRYAEAITALFSRSGRATTCIVRIFNTYGERMSPTDGRAVPTFIRQAIQDQDVTVYGHGHQTRSLCYVDDLVDGLVKAARRDISGSVINLGSSDEITMAQLARLIITLAGSSSRVVQVDRPQDDPDRRCPDLQRAADLLDWKPRTGLEAGLTRTIAWFRRQACG